MLRRPASASRPNLAADPSIITVFSTSNAITAGLSQLSFVIVPRSSRNVNRGLGMPSEAAGLFFGAKEAGMCAGILDVKAQNETAACERTVFRYEGQETRL
jgi:hypothetical protein